MNRKRGSFLISLVLCSFLISCTAGRVSVPPSSGAVSSLSLGQASGTITVDGDPLPLRYAYAQRELQRDGREVLAVLLSAVPAPAGLLDADSDLREVLIENELRGLFFRLGDEGMAEDWKVVHPRLDTGCALCSDWKAGVSRSSPGEIAGTASTAAPETTQSKRLEFRVDFRAAVTVSREIAEPGATPGQREARAWIRKAGMKFTPSWFLASRADPQAVSNFLQAGMPPDTPLPGSEETLLLETLGAVAENMEAKQVARLLIQAGADVNRIGLEGTCPLLRAGCCTDVVEALLEAGARLDLPSPIPGESVGQTLMGEAITFERPEVVRLLIRKGYDVAGERQTLMEKAEGSPAIAKILREAVAPPRKSSPAKAPGKTTTKPVAPRGLGPAQARSELARRGIPVVEDELWSAIMDPDAENLHLLLEAGVGPNIRRSHVGDTPLLFAVTMAPARGEAAKEAALTSMILDLISHGADVNAADETTDATPLLQAAQYCPPGIVRALIKAGARLQTAARGGATPLMMAVIFEKTETVRILVESGYDVAAERAGLLPLAAGKPEIERLLRQAPARQAN